MEFVMIKKQYFIALALFLAFPIYAMTAQASLIDNGGFETGDFTGWTVTTNGSGGCDTDWNVGDTGTATNCTAVDDPFEGSYAAYNSLRGNGMNQQTFRLEQEFLVPMNISSAVISWADIASWSVTGTARTFTVDLLSTSNIFTKSFNGTGTQGWTTRSFDLTTLLKDHEDELLTLAFTINIPPNSTLEAGFGLDNVAVNAVVPVPAAVWLFGTALIGFIGYSRRRNVI